MQLWASDPALPDEGEDFQFVLPPLDFGEEQVEDLYPGTILLSARTDPNGPWISSRNSSARTIDDFDLEGEFDPGSVSFEYEFPLLDGVAVTGKYYEMAGVIPQIVWDLEVKNQGRQALEIGELGFPLALNTFYDGFGWSDEQLKRLWQSRLYVHKFIGGAASWIFAQRMTAEPPGLLIFPGDNTGWEFYAHIRASLNTPHQWEGIPVVYVYSRAAIEREGWTGWSNEHSTLILEPGDSRQFQMRFVPAERDKQDGIFHTLAACDRPALRLLPSAVAPAEVGIAVEVGGITPKRFFVSRDAQVETDSDDEGGFCYVRPQSPGPVRLSFEDDSGRLSHVHLMFTEPIESLIKKRADWIVKHQIHKDPDSALWNAIVMANIATGEQVLSSEEYDGASGIECSLADALFLAEKNTIYPVLSEIQALDAYIRDFLLDDVQNPSDMSVGSVLGEAPGLATYCGRPLTYPHVVNLYHAMFRIAESYGETLERPEVYLRRAVQTAVALYRFGWRHYVRTVGLLGGSRMHDLLADLHRIGFAAEAVRIQEIIDAKAQQLVKQGYPYAGESVLDTSGFEEVFRAAMYLNDDEHMERTMRCAFAARSLAPSWWWYGSDKRSWDGADSTPLHALIDRGEACLAHTTISNAQIFFESLDRDYLAVPDAYMRLAFGGMMGPWSLIRSDGAASMCYCPDLSSKHHGYNAFTGACGLGYFHYLRQVGAYVLPSRSYGTFTFGCRFEQDDDGNYRVAPWDGVGKRVILRQIGAEFELTFGKFVEVVLHGRKRWAKMMIQNPSDKDISTQLTIRGLWGAQLVVAGKLVDSVDGSSTSDLVLPANQTVEISAKVNL